MSEDFEDVMCFAPKHVNLHKAEIGIENKNTLKGKPMAAIKIFDHKDSISNSNSDIPVLVSRTLSFPSYEDQLPVQSLATTQEIAHRDMHNIPYHEAVGSLMYVSLGTCPDITYAVQTVSRFSKNPGQAHWEAVKQIFHYLKGTK